jgi:hypothetical protein
MMATRSTVMKAERESAIGALRGCTGRPSASLGLDLRWTMDAGPSRILVVPLRALRELGVAPCVRSRRSCHLRSSEHEQAS